MAKSQALINMTKSRDMWRDSARRWHVRAKKARAANRVARAAVTGLQQTVQELVVDNDDLRRKLTGQEQANQSLSATVASLREDRANVRSGNEVLADQLERAHAIISEQEAQLARRTEQLQRASRDHGTLQTEVAELRTARDDAENATVVSAALIHLIRSKGR